MTVRIETHESQDPAVAHCAEKRVQRHARRDPLRLAQQSLTTTHLRRGPARRIRHHAPRIRHGFRRSGNRDEAVPMRSGHRDGSVAVLDACSHRARSSCFGASSASPPTGRDRRYLPRWPAPRIEHVLGVGCWKDEAALMTSRPSSPRSSGVSLRSMKIISTMSAMAIRTGYDRLSPHIRSMAWQSDWCSKPVSVTLSYAPNDAC